jgi:SAM-dependent methyltransferase
MSLLDKQTRLRSLIGRAARRTLAAVEQPTCHPVPELPAAEPQVEPEKNDTLNGEAAFDERVAIERSSFERELTPAHLAREQSTAVGVLYDRLSPHEIAAIERLIRETPGAWEHYAGAADDSARRHLLLALGMWLGADSLSDKTGLVRAEPPEEVHSMTRGALAAAGGLYEADLVVDALIGVGIQMCGIRDALDFGCSSGRVLRVMRAAYPHATWHGCDPNAPAIAWASEHLRDIEFFVNSDEPPLPFEQASLDLVYAISIWSHFAPDLGLRWFDEMHRTLRPGGHLVMTTHGLTSVAHYALLDLRTPEQAQTIREALYRRGWWYAAEFGEEGDWGVVNPEWGTAFVTPEWLLTQLCPRWRVAEFAPGRNQENQDVYVLERV